MIKRFPRGVSAGTTVSSIGLLTTSIRGVGSQTIGGSVNLSIPRGSVVIENYSDLSTPVGGVEDSSILIINSNKPNAFGRIYPFIVSPVPATIGKLLGAF